MTCESSEVRLPIKFLRALTRSMVEQIRGRGSRGRRNEIAKEVAALLSSHDIEGTVHLAIAQVVAESLNSESDRKPGDRFDFGFDPASGALCWSPSVAAQVIGVKKGQLARWRTVGHGPPCIKLGDSQQAPVVYAVSDVLAWLEERKNATETRYSDDG